MNALGQKQNVNDCASLKELNGRRKKKIDEAVHNTIAAAFGQPNNLSESNKKALKPLFMIIRDRAITKDNDGNQIPVNEVKCPDSILLYVNKTDVYKVIGYQEIKR